MTRKFQKRYYAITTSGEPNIGVLGVMMNSETNMPVNQEATKEALKEALMQHFDADVELFGDLSFEKYQMISSINAKIDKGEDSGGWDYLIELHETWIYE
jgi:hypothetical protein